uniref:AAA_28 domain-containing protein n=1 Tax=Angiostrongylus cantonensis TaxID=6313 RepID=A0A0K0D0C0_ANGCA
LSNNTMRKEDVKLAKEMDQKTRKVWLGHPYLDIVDNTECTKFEDKVLKVIQVVCDRTGIDSQDRLSKNSRKRKWLVRSIDDSRFVKYEQFNIKHEYLLTYDSESQVCCAYLVFYIASMLHGFFFRTQITFREYTRYQTMKDKTRAPLHKQRRCFMVGNQYFNLDIYTVIPPSAISLQLDNRLIFLETYTTIPVGKSVQLPDFLEIEKVSYIIFIRIHYISYNINN